MHYTHDIVAATGKYTDPTGQEKTRYLTIGRLFKRDDGSACAKLESLPLAPEWNGWVNFYPKRDPGQTWQSPASRPSNAAANAASMAAQAPASDPDNIPS